MKNVLCGKITELQNMINKKLSGLGEFL